MKQAREAREGRSRQEGEKPWRRTATRRWEGREQWISLAGCAEGGGTPGEVQSAERLAAGPSGHALKETATSREDGCVVCAAQRGAQRNTLRSRLVRQMNDVRGARNPIARYFEH